VTVMVDKWFGIHPHVVRSGRWSKLKPGEKDLYVYLMHESERHCTRQLMRTDEEIERAVGLAARTACNARKRLQEFGLIRASRSHGNKYVYVICNPENGQPYPGDPKIPIVGRYRLKKRHAEGSRL